MARSQFLPTRILLLSLLLVVLPTYGLYEGTESGVSFATTSLILGAVLFVWKWRWWWTPIREYVRTDGNATHTKEHD
ncbi:hypothetical protein [Halomarina oriensis]|uniref:Uncharacterized protein n=1 Tax=Halomarina oriensis TaxID=671145 RepID=A0A6B0GI89_9EURY|nr:hypothetical protein [Halomarina oriensis]MWG33597.1 hypothetical protein [Halomarina oriensis]